LKLLFDQPQVNARDKLAVPDAVEHVHRLRQLLEDALDLLSTVIRTALTSPVPVADRACRTHSQPASTVLNSMVATGTIWYRARRSLSAKGMGKEVCCGLMSDQTSASSER
jgi:hypothetical protein